jgi:DNA-binding MarR family transcriptional regulator
MNKKEINKEIETSSIRNMGFLIWQTSNMWKKQVRIKLNKINLTFVQFIFLEGLNELLSSKKQVTQIQLSQHINCGSMVTSNVIRTLKTYGYVAIKAHPKDTRAKLISITAEGKTTLNKAMPIMKELNSFFFEKENINDKDLQSYLLKLWLSNLSK